MGAMLKARTGEKKGERFAMADISGQKRSSARGIVALPLLASDVADEPPNARKDQNALLPTDEQSTR